MNPDSMTQVLSHTRKNHVCGRATYAWVESVVFTPSVAYKGIAVACKRNTFFFSINLYRAPHFDVCDHGHHEDGCHPVEEELAAD